MNTHNAIRLVSLLSIWMLAAQGQIFQPQLAPANFLGRITSNTVILQQPYCVFTQTCPGCEIWLVAALSTGTGNFNALVNISSPISLSVSPYPTAFLPSSAQFFLTRVGPLANFPCNTIPTFPYFTVGADGICTGINCNGVLPVGSIVSFRYLLIDPSNYTVVNMTNWGGPFNLTTLLSYQTINDGLSARSGAMVVITTLLCVAVALLLLVFFIMLCVSCCGKKDGKTVTVMSSIRIPRYDTHNLKEHVHPYDNQAYEPDAKNYSTSQTLPKSPVRK